MFDRRKMIIIISCILGGYIFYVYLPVIRTADDSK